MSLEVIIIGGGHVGRTLATRLSRRGAAVHIIERDDKRELIETTGARYVHGDGTDVETLEAANAASVDVFAAATGDDDTNLLASQLALSRFDVDRVIARVNRDGNTEPFSDLGIISVPVSEATARDLDNHIERPSFTNFIEELDHSGDAQEVELRNPEYDGVTISQLDDLFPEQCIIVMVTHEEVTQFPDADLSLALGDRVTVVGERSAVAAAREYLDPEDESHSVPDA